MKRISACRSCQSPEITSFFDLGDQPFANSLLDTQDAAEKSYPLALSWCKQCNLVQLNDTADPKELFSHYVWVTGTSSTAQEYARRFYDEVTSRCSIPDEGYVLELASNDGTFLKPFLDKGHKVLGVDPAKNIVAMAEKDGVPSLCAFWGKETADKVYADKGAAHLVFARNVLPHVANTHDFVDGLAHMLHEDGTLAIEAHYSRKILDELHYDSIYHEHLCYFTLKSLEYLLNQHGLHAFDVSESPISGGSIVLYASRDARTASASLQNLRKSEQDAGINELAAWEDFAKKSFAHRDVLLDMVKRAAQDGEVVGYGASARSSTLLNFCGIDHNLVSVIADQAPLKQGKYTPGTRILIEKPEQVIKRNPKHVLILAWNFADEIKGVLKEKLGYSGSTIVPLPNDPKSEKI